MTLTDTRPQTAPAPPAGAPSPPPAPRGLSGWLTTADHKRIGRLYVVFALLFGLAMLVVGSLLHVERVDNATGTLLLPADTIGQLFSLYGVGMVFLFALPLWLGIAISVVPLQVGARSLAFPRGAAVSFWTWLISGAVVLVAYGINGGPGGGRAEGVDLFLVAFGVLVVALCVGCIALATTVVALRAPGLTLLRLPGLAFASLVGATMLLVTLPVLVATIVYLYVDHTQARTVFGGNFGVSTYLSWAFLTPQVLAYVILPLGFVLDAVVSAARVRLTLRPVALGAIAAFGLLGFGAFAQSAFLPDVRTQALAIGMGLLAPLTVVVVLALCGLAIVQSQEQALTMPFAAAVLTGLLLLLATGAAALVGFRGLELVGTTYDTGLFNQAIAGVAVVGGIGALWFWASKLFGRTLSPGLGWIALLTGFLGAVLLPGPDFIAGLLDQPAGVVDYAAYDAAVGLNGLAAAGIGLLTLSVAVVLVGLLVAGPKRGEVADDPWGGGQSLEWATSSPPPLANFGETLPPVRSAEPLLDRNQEASRS